jgi:hypothetical protein
MDIPHLSLFSEISSLSLSNYQSAKADFASWLVQFRQAT